MQGRFCVVGGDGFIGSLLVNSLLNKGFSVHATILPTSGKEEGIDYLQRLPGADERLKLFNADLRVEGSFDLPISGCEGVFFVASPMDFRSKDPENEVVGVAVHGTINVLKSCVKAKTVKRVVFTSSCCAMSPLNEQGEMNNQPCSVESFWSPVNYFRSNTEKFPLWVSSKLVNLISLNLICSEISIFKRFSNMKSMYCKQKPYFVSKTLAEQTAWSFAAEHNLDLVTTGASLVGGPFITPYIPGSVKALLWFLPGNKEHSKSVVRSVLSAFGTFPVVHVSDVCNAHIFLMEQTAAQGRYLCSPHMLSVKELDHFLAKRYPDIKITDMLQDVQSIAPLNTHFESERLTDLGFTFKHGIEEIYEDCIESYKKLGFIITG